MEDWKMLVFKNYREIVRTLNTLKLKREDILTIDRDTETGEITIIYYD